MEPHLYITERPTVQESGGQSEDAAAGPADRKQYPQAGAGADQAEAGDAGLPADHDDPLRLQEPLSTLASMMQKNINVYSGNDKRFGQLRDALLFMVLGLVISAHSAQRSVGA